MKDFLFFFVVVAVIAFGLVFETEGMLKVLGVFAVIGLIGAFDDDGYGYSIKSLEKMHGKNRKNK